MSSKTDKRAKEILRLLLNHGKTSVEELTGLFATSPASVRRDLVRLDDAAFRRTFAKTPVKRTGRDRFVRNVLIAIGNSGDPTFVPEAERLLADRSSFVRAAAIWALGRLDRDRLTCVAPEYRSRETDALVQEEWAAMLSEDVGEQ